MKALQFKRSIGKYVAARAAGSIVAGRGSKYGPLALRDIDVPDLPSDEWVRIRPRLTGICGSDLATIDGRSAANITFNDVAATELEASEGAVEKIISDAIIVQSAAGAGLDAQAALEALSPRSAAITASGVISAVESGARGVGTRRAPAP